MNPSLLPKCVVMMVVFELSTFGGAGAADTDASVDHAEIYRSPLAARALLEFVCNAGSARACAAALSRWPKPAADIDGHVLDATGAAAGRVHVSIIGGGVGVWSDANGHFRIPGARSGDELELWTEDGQRGVVAVFPGRRVRPLLERGCNADVARRRHFGRLQRRGRRGVCVWRGESGRRVVVPLMLAPGAELRIDTSGARANRVLTGRVIDGEVGVAGAVLSSTCHGYGEITATADADGSACDEARSAVQS